MRRLVLAGSSHLGAMGVPLVTEDRSNVIVEVPHSPLGKIVAATGELPRTGAYWHFVVETCANDTVAVMWKGNQHLSSFLFESEQPFDFVVPSNQELPISERSTVVPTRVIEAHLEEGMEQLGAICKKLKKAGNRVIVCAPPPPKGDDNFIRGALGHEEHFVALAQKIGKDLSTIHLTSPHVRYKLWLVLQGLYQELAKNHGALFFAVPAEAQDDQGFLNRSFWANDASHANEAYGKLYLEKLCSFAARLEEKDS